jgi:hypothetical protein
MRLSANPARRLALVTVAIAAACAFTAQTGEPAFDAPAAPSIFVSTTGSDGAPCTRARPCASFDRAYHAARPGDVVEIAGGTYDTQTLTPDTAKGSGAMVVFRPAPNADVTVTNELAVRGAQHIEFRNLHLRDGFHVYTASSDITFRDVEAARLYIDSASDIRLIGGTMGPTANYDSQIRPSGPGAPPPHNIVIDGVTFHDSVLTPGSDEHVECLQVGEIDGLSIRNSRFDNCETHYVFISPFWGGPESNIVLENNIGGRIRDGFYGFRLAAGGSAETCGDVAFRYNSAIAPFSVACGRLAGKVQLVANVGPYPGDFACDSRFVYSHNVWNGAKCSPTDANGPSGFRDPNAADLHLVANAAAIGHGDPQDHPAGDIDGDARPLRWPADAGADQREPATIVLGRAIGSVKMGMTQEQVAAFYGRRSLQRVTLGRRRTRASTAVYRVHGGRLEVTYVSNRVVGIATTSVYYTTASGFGAGVRTAGAGALSGARWLSCRKAYRRQFGSTTVEFAPLRGRRGAPLGRISMMQISLGDC